MQEMNEVERRNVELQVKEEFGPLDVDDKTDRKQGPTKETDFKLD